MEATFGAPLQFEAFEDITEGQPVCFEKAVVMRHNEGGMSRQRRMETYDFMRCKARLFCNLTSPEPLSAAVGMTMLMRTGPRSFRNETTVVEIFGKECAKVAGCRLTVAYSNNLTFCEQVTCPLIYLLFFLFYFLRFGILNFVVILFKLLVN